MGESPYRNKFEEEQMYPTKKPGATKENGSSPGCVIL